MVFLLMNEVCAKDFLNLSDNDLRKAGLSRLKINYLKGVADQELSGKFDFKDLSEGWVLQRFCRFK